MNDKLSERMRKSWPPQDLEGAGWMEGEEDRIHAWADEVAALEQRVERFENIKKAAKALHDECWNTDEYRGETLRLLHVALSEEEA